MLFTYLCFYKQYKKKSFRLYTLPFGKDSTVHIWLSMRDSLNLLEKCCMQIAPQKFSKGGLPWAVAKRLVDPWATGCHSNHLGINWGCDLRACSDFCVVFFKLSADCRVLGRTAGFELSLPEGDCWANSYTKFLGTWTVNKICDISIYVCKTS